MRFCLIFLDWCQEVCKVYYCPLHGRVKAQSLEVRPGAVPLCQMSSSWWMWNTMWWPTCSTRKCSKSTTVRENLLNCRHNITQRNLTKNIFLGGNHSFKCLGENAVMSTTRGEGGAGRIGRGGFTVRWYAPFGWASWSIQDTQVTYKPQRMHQSHSCKFEMNWKLNVHRIRIENKTITKVKCNSTHIFWFQN